MSADAAGVSRRALLGAGLARVARAGADRLAVGAPAVAPRRTEPGAAWAASGYGAAGPPLDAVADRCLEALALRPGETLLDVAPPAPALADRARASGVRVEAATPGEADPEALPWPGATFDAVVSAFGIAHAPAMRAAGAELARVLRPGGRAVLAVWSSGGAMAPILRARRAAAAAATGRPERWGSYDGLLLALDRCAGLQVAEHAVSWAHADRDALWAALAAPGGLVGDAAARPQLERRLDPYVEEVAGGVALRLEWLLATAVAVG